MHEPAFTAARLQDHGSDRDRHLRHGPEGTSCGFALQCGSCQRGGAVYQANPTYPPLLWNPPLLIANTRGASAACVSGLNLSPVRMPTLLSFPRGIATMSRLPEGLD